MVSSRGWALSWYFTVCALWSHRCSSHLVPWPWQTDHHVAAMLILTCIARQHSTVPHEESSPSFLLFGCLLFLVSSTVSSLSLVSGFLPKLPSLPLENCGTLSSRRRRIYDLVYSTKLCTIIAASSIHQTCFDWVSSSDCFCNFDKDMSSTFDVPWVFCLSVCFLIGPCSERLWKCLFGLTKLLWQMFYNCERIWPLLKSRTF